MLASQSRNSGCNVWVHPAKTNWICSPLARLDYRLMQHHPFQFIDWKEEAGIQKQAAQRSAERTTEARRRYYMDFGFMLASTSHYDRPGANSERVVHSWDGYSSLLIVDKATRYIWVFLTKSKSPPLEILNEFFTRYGHPHGGSVRTDQGGELGRSTALSDLILRKFHYVLEPPGADSPSQNGAVEIYNDKLAIRTRTLLYSSGLLAKYWSSALQHSVYLHNRLVHKATKMTPFEGIYQTKPDLSHLKVFGSRVCVKISGIRRGKLDKHDFKGIFLGYTATDHNIVYLDLNSGVVKRSHHAEFDEAWYLQQSCPPAAQHLYDIGLAPIYPSEPEQDVNTPVLEVPMAAWPPEAPTTSLKQPWSMPKWCTCLPLPIGHTAFDTSRHPITAKAAKTSVPGPNKPRLARRRKAIDIMADYEISKRDMAMIYLSPTPYFDAFEQPLDLRQFNLAKHATAGQA